MIWSTTLDNPPKMVPIVFSNVDDCSAVFRVVQSVLHPRKCFAAYLQDGPSRICRSNRLCWQLDVSRYTTHFFLRTNAMVALADFESFSTSFGASLFATFIRLVFDTSGRMPTTARRFRALFFQVAVTPRLVCFSAVSLGDRGPGEGERGRSRLPLLLPFLFTRHV